MILLCWILITSWVLPLEHDIHVSVCDIKIESTSTEIILKTFLDDLQYATNLTPGEEVPEGYTSSEEIIGDYIKSVINIQVDGDQKKLIISEISASLDAVWINLEIEQLPESFQSMTVNSSFLTDIYQDQTNIVNIRTNGKKKSFVLNNKKKQASYEIE